MGFLIINILKNIQFTIIFDLCFDIYCKNQEILGIDFEGFKLYIENLFIEGMTWENFGKWHLDHKIPISWGKTEDEIIRLNHYTNLQPLWAEDNLSKGNRYSS